MPAQFPRKGLYAITDSALMPAEHFLSMVESAIRGGIQVVQYREKTLPEEVRLEQAKALVRLCKDQHTICLINDDPELAAASGAHGVHLGQSDAALAKARELLGPEAIIGITCHNSLELAGNAQAHGANYVAFGRFFPSSTKSNASACNREILTLAKARLDIPIVAIGGITPENGAVLLDAGADWLAVIAGIFGQSEITDAASQYRLLFN